MRAPDKPSDIKHSNIPVERSVLLNGFAKEIIHSNVVLLLGHDSLLRIPSSEEAAQDDYLHLLRECNGSMEKWMKFLKERYYDNKKYASVKDFYVGIRTNSEVPRLDASDLNPEVRSLIESKAFRVILTTTYDSLIEEVMEKAWGGKGSINVVNFGDRQNKDIKNVDKVVLADDLKPTLYYLFGKATYNSSTYGNSKFIVDDEDYIRIIREWMVSPPHNLMAYLANKRLLAIGCKFENWLFRFFWRAVLEEENNADDFKYLLAISFSSADDDKLKEVFRLYNLRYQEDVDEFLHGLNNAIIEQKQRAFLDERRDGGIFLSYCSKDYQKVLNLFYKLIDLGFNVWIDKNELTYGNEYKKVISAAIRKCTVFVPVLSREISTHLPTKNKYDEHDPNFHFYRDYEWNEAVLRYENDKTSSNPKQNSIHILPFALNDYNPGYNEVPAEVRSDYPLIFEKTLLSYNNAGFVRFVNELQKIFNDNKDNDNEKK